MTVMIEFVNVLVPVSRINEIYPGGIEAYERDAPNRSFDCDGELARIGFMSPADADSFIRELEKCGFRTTQDEADIAVVDMIMGTFCPWIEVVREEGSMIQGARLIEEKLPDPPEPWEE